MKILMVCLGNICRSPLAEGILRSKLPANFQVDSRGTIPFHDGKKADERSIEVANRNGISIEQHRASVLSEEDTFQYDRIYCMDKSNLKEVLLIADKKDQGKARLLLPNQGEVPDPYYGTMDDFENVYQMLDQACSQIAKELISNKK